MQRRAFIRYLGAVAAGTALGGVALADSGKKSRKKSSSTPSGSPVPADTGAHGRVVVIGGGMAGATAAKYLRVWGGAGVQVTLIERETAYTSNIMSNLVLNGSRSMSSLTYGYDTLASTYGVSRVAGEVVAIDPIARSVSLADGRKIGYDRLIVAPGIDFETVPGLESAAAQSTVLHAWKAGPQTTALWNQIKAIPAGGVFVMTIPKAPYRCPPGPYERACVVADYLKVNKPGAKVIVLDANPGITAEPTNFGNAFSVIHKGVVEYVPNAEVLSVDAASRSVSTALGSFTGDVVNVIPPQRAGSILASAGLTNVGGRWAGVDVLSYESTVAPGIHIIGDASATTQPKAGHVANAEAKVCADAICRLLRGEAPDPAPVTNSACYSPITASTASWLTVVFGYDAATRTMKAIPGTLTEAPGPTSGNFKQMNAWFANLMADTFA